MHNRFVQRRVFRPDVHINIAPLVDVMLVLLIVFMVTAPMLTVGIPVDLPKTKAAKMREVQKPVIITINDKGQVFIQEMQVQQQEFIRKLQLITQNNKDIEIFVRGDKTIAYGWIMQTMGAISEAGFKKVSLIAEMQTDKKSA